MGQPGMPRKRQGVSHEGALRHDLCPAVARVPAAGQPDPAAPAGQMTAAGHHMANSAISNIESGRRQVTIGEAVQLAAALSIPLLALVTDGPPDDLIEARAATWR